MGKPIKSITVVGGGTAGWLTASLLNAHLSKSDDPNAPKVTLIESPDVPTVGVGEATVPNMPRTLQDIGIDQETFFRECNASFKLGVLFGGWNVDQNGKKIDYINPFSRSQFIHGYSTAHYFRKFGDGKHSYASTMSPHLALYHAGKGPGAVSQDKLHPAVGYAYHLDAGLFAKLLQRHATERGVRHVLDNVLSVEQDERGFITQLNLQHNEPEQVEFVIDCTGFRGLIINEMLKQPFIDYSRYLANDRAMAIQIPHPDEHHIDSVTKATALGAGWSWRVPLYNRIGTGYVFSSAHRTDEEARDEFCNFLGDQRPKDAEPRIIPMRIGRNEKAWVGNCVCMGLSGGFIEPLESTAIHMIDMSIRWLLMSFPNQDCPPPIVDRYNQMVANLYDEVRDFICVHYALSNRTDDQYWSDARALDVPDSLAENLETWKYRLPFHYDLKFSSLFSATTYEVVLLGKRVYETGFGKGSFVDNPILNRREWVNYTSQMRSGIAKLTQHMSSHRDLLNKLRGEEVSLTEPAGSALFSVGSTATATVAVPERANLKSSKLDFKKIVEKTANDGDVGLL